MEAQLRQAAAEGNLPTVQRILQQPGGVNVNSGTQSGWTALHYAVLGGHVAIVQAISQTEGANVNVRNVTGYTPLHMAFRLTDGDRLLPMIQALLDAGAEPNIAADNGQTPLFHAVAAGEINAVEALLNRGADPAARDSHLNIPLHNACFMGRLDVVELLIQRQGSECLTLKNNREETPLDELRGQNRSEVKASIRQHILQSYAGMIAQRDGLLCLHSVLQDAAFTDVSDDGNDEEFVLPVGKLNTEHLQKLLEYIIAMEPGSVRTLNIDGLMPLQVASQLNYPDLVLNALLRPYPDALLLL